MGREPARVRLGVGKESKGGGWAGLVCWAGWAAWVPSWAKRPSGGGGSLFIFLFLLFCFSYLYITVSILVSPYLSFINYKSSPYFSVNK